LGTVWGTRAALRRMRPRDRGTIVQVGSALAYRSIPLQAPYCGAKAAIRGFTDSLRSELIHARSRVHLTMVQLAAFNTPQFQWGRTTMGCRPRPMGRIFQPEVAARGIYHAATHRRREMVVGAPALTAIYGGGMLARGYADHKLARDAVDGQHTDESLPPDRQDNLYQPVPGDHAAHGRFDDKATDHSTQLWMTTHRGRTAAGAALLPTAALAALRRRSPRNPPIPATLSPCSRFPPPSPCIPRPPWPQCANGHQDPARLPGTRDRPLAGLVGALAPRPGRGRQRLHADRAGAGAAGLARRPLRLPACAGAAGHDQQRRADAGLVRHPRLRPGEPRRRGRGRGVRRPSRGADRTRGGARGSRVQG